MDNFNVYKGNKLDRLSATATKSTLRPGDFSLGSIESRAAARAIMEERSQAKMAIQIVFVSPDGSTKDGPQIKPHG